MEVMHVELDTDQKMPKYEQFVNLLLQKIGQGEIRKGQKLPSIIDASHAYGLSRDTVLRAYKELYNKGTLTSIYRKGYYVCSNAFEKNGKKILVLTSRFTTANHSFYTLLCQAFEERGLQCDIRTFNDCTERLENQIKEAAGNYHTFIVEPQMQSTSVITDLFKNKVVDEEIIILNDCNQDPGFSCRHILFDIELDLQECLEQLSERMDSYSILNLVLPEEEYFSYKIIRGFFNYCDKNLKNGNVLEEVKQIQKDNVYIFLDEQSFLLFLEECAKSHVRLGSDTGVLTLFEKPYFEYLTSKITSISWFNKNLVDRVVHTLIENKHDSLHARSHLQIRQSL